jgi:hypothetical protein
MKCRRHKAFVLTPDERHEVYPMLFVRRLGYVLWIISSLFVTGCDPVRTTSQTLHLRVTDSASGNPVADATVRMKYDFERWFPLSQETLKPPEWWHEDRRKFWEEFPWSLGVTDKDGRAEIEIKHTKLDRTWGAKPPASRDTITGKPYLIGLAKGEAPEEELSVLMKPGESVKGKSFTATVIDIQQPRYVETKNN